MRITMGQNRDNSDNILKINEGIEFKYLSIKIIQSVILYTELLGSFQETFVLNQTVILPYRFAPSAVDRWLHSCKYSTSKENLFFMNLGFSEQIWVGDSDEIPFVNLYLSGERSKTFFVISMGKIWALAWNFLSSGSSTVFNFFSTDFAATPTLISCKGSRLFPSNFKFISLNMFVKASLMTLVLTNLCRISTIKSFSFSN